MNKDVTVVIPAYNEEYEIGMVVAFAKLFAKNILVVDDGSIDNTAKEAKKEGAKVLKLRTNSGKGEAIRRGIRKAKTKYIVIMDGDGQYISAYIPDLINGLKDADYVVGQRKWSSVPFRHRVGNWVWVKTFNLLYGTNLNDVCCGFVAMTKEVADDLNPYGGYMTDASMLIQLLKKGYKIKNVQVDVHYDETSGVRRGIRMVLGILVFMIGEKIRW